MKLEDAWLFGRKAMTNPDSILKSRDITLPTEVRLVKVIVFSSSHVWMWELDYKESWAHELEWTLGVGDGQGGLACCDSWRRKESDTTERLNWTEHQRIDAFELWCWRRLVSPLDYKEIQPVNPKLNQSWKFIGRSDAEAWSSKTWTTWCEELIHWKTPWCWERLKAGGEGDDRGWEGWMASLTWWTWVWVSSRSWW